MGVVWAAEDTLLRRRVALKEVQPPPELTQEEREKIRARILREARAAAGIDHSAAVTVYDVAEQDGKTYIVMELVPGPTLAEVIEEKGTLSPKAAGDIGLCLLGALEEAHARGIVHRDVKPSNVIVPPDAPIKLTDFGIASVKGDPRITTSGLLMGSPSFMSPEQAKGEAGGPAADLWGLGATLYFTTEGKPPFDKGQPIPTLTAAVNEEPPFPAKARELGGVIMALLEKDPSRRLTAHETRRRLEQITTAHGVDTSATTVVVGGAGASTARATAAAPAPAVLPGEARRDPRPAPALRPEAPARSRAGMVLAAILGVIVLLGLVLFLGGRDDPADPPAGRAADRRTPRERPTSPAAGGGGQESPAASPTEPATSPPASPDAAVVPAGWVPYEGLPEGFTISYPEGWDVTRETGNQVDFDDPGSSTYLRVAWISPPSSDDPVAKAEEIEQGLAARYPTYERITLEPATYRGFEAVDWEYTYSAGGAQLHATNLQFITGDYGFALNFQTAETDWEESQPLYEQFEGSFVTP